MRTRSHLYGTIIALALLLGSAAAISDEASSVPWRPGLGEALDEAVRSNLPVLVDVWAVWCQPCLEMEKTTYKDPVVLERVKSIVPVKVNADLQEQFISRYGVDAYPTVLVLDGKGRALARKRGMVSARRLAKLLQTVEAGYRAYLDAVDKLDDPASAVQVADYLQQLDNNEGAEEHLRRSIKALKKDDAPRQAVELRLAELQLATGETRRAQKSFDKLYAEASSGDVRSRALYGRLLAERKLGNAGAAAELHQQLKLEFPELAALADAPVSSSSSRSGR